MLRLGARFYYPIAGVALMLIIGIVIRDALGGNYRLRRLADLVLIGGVCALVLFWRAERMWLRGQVNWLVRGVRPDRAVLWSGVAAAVIALGLFGFVEITGPNSAATDYLWPLFLFPLLFLAERGDTLPFLFVLSVSCLLLTFLRLSVGKSLSDALTPALWLATLATSNFYLARRHLLLELRTALLRQIAHQLSSTPDVDTSFETITATIGRRLRHDHLRLWLLDTTGERLTLRAAWGTPNERWEGFSLPAASGIPGSVVRRRLPERWDDVSDCPHYQAQSPFEWVRSALAVPIVVADQAVGALEALSRQTAEFWELDEEHLSLMADSIGLALARSQHVRREAERLRDTLWHAVSQLGDCTSIQDMFDAIAREAQAHLGADLVLLYQLAPGTGYPLAPPLFTGGLRDPDSLNRPEIPPGSVLFDLLEKWEPYYSDNAPADPILGKGRLPEGAAPDGATPGVRVRFIFREAIRSVAFLPLGSRSKRVGALFLHYRTRREFSPLDKLSLEAFASLVAEQINRERAHWRKYEAFGGALFGVHGPLSLSADSLRRFIGAAREALPSDPATAAEALERAQQVARKLELAAMLTRLAQREWLEEMGLREELRRAATKIVQLVEPDCRVYADIPAAADDLPIELLDALYCLAVEAVANAAIHGHARRIDLTVELDPASIRLTVADNGQGFDTAQAIHGPNGIFEGLELVQQQFAARGCLDSRPGAGARVEIEFPCLADTVR